MERIIDCSRSLSTVNGYCMARCFADSCLLLILANISTVGYYEVYSLGRIESQKKSKWQFISVIVDKMFTKMLF